MQHLLPPERPIFRVIPSEEWRGAKSPISLVSHKPTRIVVHHSWSPSAADWKGAGTVKAIYDYHVKSRGWLDIGYHFIISPDGSEIYECRPADKIGAHCGGSPPAGVERIFGNTGSIGICLIGNYDVEKPDRDALRTLAVLIADLCERWQINTAAIFGHCEAWSKPPKTCPGKHLYQALFGADRWNIIF
jgi:N-acetylmuramoyl-L-alanine amidase